MTGCRGGRIRLAENIRIISRGATVNGKQRPPNRILRRIREVERQETREEFAESVVAAARAFGVEIACNYRTIARWEDGETA